MRTALAVALLALTAAHARAEAPRYLGTDEFTGGSAAVVVGPAPLVHTCQVLPVRADGRVVGKGRPARQVGDVFVRLEQVLTDVGVSFDDVVKLNVYASSPEVVAEVKKTLRDDFRAGRVPAVTFVAGRLAHPDALVALDAVAVGSEKTPAGPYRRAPHPWVVGGAHGAVLPAGRRVYVSGQAEKGGTPAEAARKTLASLRATLKWLGLDDRHVVQCKSFLTPISAAAEVAKEFDAHFGAGKVPPLVFVEWDSTLPIEIELIAAVPPGAGPGQATAVEFLTPPGMKESPIYSRVTRVKGDRFVYTGGLVSPKAGNGEEQVAGVFERLRGILRDAGSDFGHLVKATYYVSDEDASGALNRLRPRYYDPKRPPAASKAKVAGTGVEGRSLVVDMIAVPAAK